MRSRFSLCIGILIVSFIVCGSLHTNECYAQSDVDENFADTSSPRAKLRSLIDACNKVDELVKQQGFLQRSRDRLEPLSSVAVDCLDTSELPTYAANERAVEVAVCIKEIIDRHQMPPWDEIPDSKMIKDAGGLENLSIWRIPGTRLTISRVVEGDRKHEYLFSTGTVNRAVDYYYGVASRPYRETGPQTSPGLYQCYMSAPGHPMIAGWVSGLSDRMRFGRSFGLTNWKWPGLLIALLVATTIMLMADKPSRVGERIVFKGYDGVVEDIGLRSTRIRLLTSHQVSVPNDQLAGSDIENIGRRDCIRRTFDMQIPHDTPCEKVEQAVALIREQLDQHEGMQENFPPRVFFLDFLPTAFTIRAIYWYHPADYWDYLAFSEKFNFAIFRAFEKHGIQFSLPQRITHTSLESDQAPIDVRMIGQH